MPELVLRDPVEHVGDLYDSLRGELEQQGWSLADLYRELGGGGPRTSPLHDRFSAFFNGQARSILAPWHDPSRLEYWAGMPERGAALRDTALETLERNYEVGVAERFGRPDPETRSLILAHNQIDAELHAHFLGAGERDRPRSRPSASRPSPPRGAICVLGAPRSGTSLTTRILNILGVDLGPEGELMEPASGNNPAGFWEHDGIAGINEEILATLGGAPRQRWRWPPPLGEDWQRDPRLESLRQSARGTLEQSFADRPLWGWKDPRTCVTLPFWQEVLPQTARVETGTRYVICTRHPQDVAASLQARDGMPAEESFALWLRYMSDALAHTGGQPRLCLSYESYFTEWEIQAERLAAFLGLPALDEEQREAIAAHIDRTLWHHRDATQRPALPADCAALYAELLELARA
ncbi:MAG: sulfotransferase [Solirubrobacterales bacterium]